MVQLELAGVELSAIRTLEPMSETLCESEPWREQEYNIPVLHQERFELLNDLEHLAIFTAHWGADRPNAYLSRVG